MHACHQLLLWRLGCGGIEGGGIRHGGGPDGGGIDGGIDEGVEGNGVGGGCFGGGGTHTLASRKRNWSSSPCCRLMCRLRATQVSTRSLISCCCLKVSSSTKPILSCKTSSTDMQHFAAEPESDSVDMLPNSPGVQINEGWVNEDNACYNTDHTGCALSDRLSRCHAVFSCFGTVCRLATVRYGRFQERKCWPVWPTGNLARGSHAALSVRHLHRSGGW